MGTCSGNCSSCGGCVRELVLTNGELDFLNQLGQYAFLPVARTLGDLAPVYLEEGDREQMSLILQCLEKKGLILLDYTRPLGGCDLAAYQGYPIQGTISLTQRGQQVLEMIEYQGIQ